jgi:hypothetical protein
MIYTALHMGARLNGVLSWYHNGERRILNNDNADIVGQMLQDENVRSVSTRYEDDKLTNLPGTGADWVIPYHFNWIDGLSAVRALKLIDCYDYQSCESEDWKQTEAYAFCDALRQRLIGCLDGYDSADWEYVDREVQRRVKV